MSRVAQCWDNAPAERVFGTPDRELGAEVLADRGQARAEIFEDLEVFGDRVRRHVSLGYVSPYEFERAHNQDPPLTPCPLSFGKVTQPSILGGFHSIGHGRRGRTAMLLQAMLHLK